MRRARTSKVIGGWHVSRLVIDWCDWRFGVWVNRSPIGIDVWFCFGPLVVSAWKRRDVQ